MMVAEGKRSRGLAFFLGTAVLGLFLGRPDLAWALQQHGGPEGMIVHELGHLLFLFGMAFLLYRMGQPETRKLTRGSGWFEFKLSIWLIILWNVLTFYGHWHQELISPDKFVRTGGKISAFIITRPLDLFFYFSRLDHLLLLPAFLCLLLALRKWRQQG
ncbi:MAG: hypothetical protein ACYDBT_08520 [Desulfobulbaceae bacterium]